MELADGTMIDADVYGIDGAGAYSYLAEHDPGTPTHIIVNDEDGNTQRFHLETGTRSPVQR